MAKQKFKEFPNNPRRISDQRLLQLAESLAEYGSLDGFVVNRSPGKYKDCIVSGNQKNKHVNLSDAEIQITAQYDEPTAAGTLCVGHVVYKGERFPYREVSWSERKCEIANLRANNYGGENDYSLLLKFDADVLELGGVDLKFEDAKLSFGNDSDNAKNSEAQELPTPPDYDELIGEEKAKPPTLKITFQSPEQLQKAETEIIEIISRFEGAFYSISAGEI